MNTADKIHGYLVENCMPGKSGKDLKMDDSILESGLLDSAAIFELVSFLERTFSIEIDDEEIVPENFDSVASIAKTVESKFK